MALEIKKHAALFLELLYDSPDASVSFFLSTYELAEDDGWTLVQYLSSRGFVDDHSTFGNPAATITAEGIALVQNLRAELMGPAQRLGTLRSRMLAWLEELGQQGQRPKDWSEFLAGSNIGYNGQDFTKGEVAREAGYLESYGLITSIPVWNASQGMYRPTITTQGRDCLIDFGGNVSDYLARSQRSNHTTSTTITMTGSTGNITVASENVIQNVDAGLDTTKLLDFAGFVRQTLSTLGLGEDEGEALDAQADELHQEAQTASPDRGKLRRLLDAILDGLRRAAPTVVQKTAIAMGEEAVKTITGG